MYNLILKDIDPAKILAQLASLEFVLGQVDEDSDLAQSCEALVSKIREATIIEEQGQLKPVIMPEGGTKPMDPEVWTILQKRGMSTEPWQGTYPSYDDCIRAIEVLLGGPGSCIKLRADEFVAYQTNRDNRLAYYALATTGDTTFYLSQHTE